MKKIIVLVIAALLMASLLPAAVTAEQTEAETHPVPTAEILADRYYRPVAAMEQGTAGSALRRAQLVHDIFAFCSEYAIPDTDAGVLGQHILDAQALLTEEERAAYSLHETEVLEEALRLMEEEEIPGEEYADAGVAEALEALRKDPEVCESVRFFLFCVSMLDDIVV